MSNSQQKTALPPTVPSPKVTPPAVIETKPVVDEPTSPDGALEFMWQAFTNLNEWVRFSDAKAAAVLAANGVIIGALATVLAGTKPTILRHPIAIFWICCIIVAAFYSAAYALRSIMPQLKVTFGEKKPAPKNDASSAEESSSLIFFMDIDKKFPSWKEFHNTVKGALADSERAVAEISQQVWCNSKVAAKKYHYVDKSLQGLLAVFIIGFIGVACMAIYHLVTLPK